MKKTIKSLLCAVALTGMGCSAMGQGNFDALPDCYKDLKPWIDDSTSGLASVFHTEEWGGFVKSRKNNLYKIIRNPEENKVVLKEDWGMDFIFIHGCMERIEELNLNLMKGLILQLLWKDAYIHMTRAGIFKVNYIRVCFIPMKICICTIKTINFRLSLRLM